MPSYVAKSFPTSWLPCATARTQLGGQVSSRSALIWLLVMSDRGQGPPSALALQGPRVRISICGWFWRNDTSAACGIFALNRTRFEYTSALGSTCNRTHEGGNCRISDLTLVRQFRIARSCRIDCPAIKEPLPAVTLTSKSKMAVATSERYVIVLRKPSIPLAEVRCVIMGWS